MGEDKYIVADADASHPLATLLAVLQSEPATVRPSTPLIRSSHPKGSVIVKTEEEGHIPTQTSQPYKPRQMSYYPVGQHALTMVWMELAPKIMDLLDSMNVKMTSLEANRKGYSDDPSPPVVVLIGIVPGSLSDKTTVVDKCREILDSYNLTDVKVEIRERVIVPAVGSA